MGESTNGHEGRSEPLRPAADINRAGIVVDDTPCVMCGYNLRTLPLLGRCPECAHPVHDSLHGPKLIFANPEWARGLAWGVGLTFGSVYAAIVLVPILIGAAFWLGSETLLLKLYTGVALPALVVAFAAGVFLSTRAEPFRSSAGSRQVVRRAAAATGYIAALLILAAWASGGQSLFLTIAAVLSATAVFAPLYLWHLAELLTRTPTSNAARSTRFLAAALPICGGLIVLSLVAQRLLRRPYWLETTTVVLCGVGAVLLLVSLATIGEVAGMLSRARKPPRSPKPQ